MYATPEVHFARARDGLNIAYSMDGEGQPLVYVRGLNSHTEHWWTQQPTENYLKTLARCFTVVVFDARGNGNSDAATTIDLDGLVEDLRAVIEDADLTNVTVYGQGFGSPVAMAYAAREPVRVKRLLLYCAYARAGDARISDEFIETMRTMPAAATAFMARSSYPDDHDLPARLLTTGALHASRETAAAYFEFARSVDVQDELSRIAAPTLVMQPERSPVVPARFGQDVAEAIPDARFVSIPGGAYNAWASMAFEPTLRAIGDFVGLELIGQGRPAVVLLTDMVGSTAMTQRLGEHRSRELHELHDSIVGRALAGCRGYAVEHTGDGIMACFSSAADALNCAITIQQEVAERNRDASDPLELRVGVAHGKVYEHTGQPFRSAAQLVTRLTAHGGGGQIVATATVREMAKGHSFEFGNGRSVALKGFPERVRLHEVFWRK